MLGALVALGLGTVLPSVLKFITPSVNSTFYLSNIAQNDASVAQMACTPSSRTIQSDDSVFFVGCSGFF